MLLLILVLNCSMEVEGRWFYFVIFPKHVIVTLKF